MIILCLTSQIVNYLCEKFQHNVFWTGKYSLTKYASEVRCHLWVWILLICCLCFPGLVNYLAEKLVICTFTSRHVYISVCVGLFAVLLRYVTSPPCLWVQKLHPNNRKSLGCLPGVSFLKSHWWMSSTLLHKDKSSVLILEGVQICVIFSYKKRKRIWKNIWARIDIDMWFVCTLTL